MTIRFVFFDWGSTLARPRTRAQFIRTPSKDVLYPGAMSLLRTLKRQGIGIGLISNMQYSPSSMNKALRQVGLDRYFDVIVYNTTPGLCKKPCTAIFKKALTKASVSPHEAIMVGNSVDKDIVPFLRLGGKAIHIDPIYTRPHQITNNLIVVPNVGHLL